MLKLNNFFGNKKEETYEFPKQTTINCETFNIEVIFAKKKNSSVMVKDDKLIFRLSEYLRTNQVKSHFESLLESITKKVEKLNLKPNKNSFDKILEKGYFSFDGRYFRFEISNKISGVKFKENTFYYNPTIDEETIEKRITKKLIDLKKNEVEKYIRELNKRTYDYDMREFRLKNLDSKWGHCTANNDIMINVKLLNTKREIFDYVIIHELSHIKVKNHSRRFWQEVERFCPNYRELRKELRQNPPRLFI